jgi:hypothetical protein
VSWIRCSDYWFLPALKLGCLASSRICPRRRLPLSFETQQPRSDTTPTDLRITRAVESLESSERGSASAPRSNEATGFS